MCMLITGHGHLCVGSQGTCTTLGMATTVLAASVRVLRWKWSPLCWQPMYVYYAGHGHLCVRSQCTCTTLDMATSVLAASVSALHWAWSPLCWQPVFVYYAGHSHLCIGSLGMVSSVLADSVHPPFMLCHSMMALKVDVPAPLQVHLLQSICMFCL